MTVSARELGAVTLPLVPEGNLFRENMCTVLEAGEMCKGKTLDGLSTINFSK